MNSKSPRVSFQSRGRRYRLLREEKENKVDRDSPAAILPGYLFLLPAVADVRPRPSETLIELQLQVRNPPDELRRDIQVPLSSSSTTTSFSQTLFASAFSVPFLPLHVSWKSQGKSASSLSSQFMSSNSRKDQRKRVGAEGKRPLSFVFFPPSF